MAFRKDRTHGTGASNRLGGWKPIKEGPTDFDSTMRSTLAREYNYHMSRSVPLNQALNQPNTDFDNTLPGAGYFKIDQPQSRTSLEKNLLSSALKPGMGFVERIRVYCVFIFPITGIHHLGRFFVRE